LKKSVDMTVELLKLEPALVPESLLHSIVDFSIVNRSNR
jgi:hypothetical protein